MALRRIEVNWRDAQHVGNWRSVAEARSEAAEPDVFDQQSAGYLLELTDDYVLLAMNYKAGDELVADTMQIPRSEVVSIHQLRLDKPL